ncbi:Nephrocystin-3 [Orbilia brochopaga]|nr:Nephrocystin-3 [Drechslerella brochopaga]
MPLTVSHAGCFIYESNIAMGEYVKYYDEAFMTVQSKKPKSAWNYRNDTAATAWELSFSEVQKQDEEAALLLLTCSYLNPAEILENLWEDESSDIESRLRHKEKLSLLASYSLIKRTQFGAFSVHPVVHTWARERLDTEDRLPVVENAFNVIGRALCRKQLLRSSSKWDGREERRIVAHLEGFDRYSGPIFLKFLDYKETRPKKLITYNAMHRIGLVFDQERKYDKAMKWTERALAGFIMVLGKSNSATMTVTNDVAQILSHQGNYQEAMKKSEEVLAWLEAHSDQDSLSHLSVVGNLANNLRSQGKYDESMQLYKRALAGYEKARGLDARNTLNAVNSIAGTLVELGNFDEAMQWFRRGLAGLEKTLGPDHADTLDTVNDIALTYGRQQNYEEAFNWHKRALTGYEKVLGKEHPDTVKLVRNIAFTLARQKHFDEALPWYERALAGSQTISPGNSDETSEVLYSIAWIHRELGRYNESIEWGEKALLMSEQVFGKDHPNTIIVADHLMKAQEALLNPRMSHGDTQSQSISDQQSKKHAGGLNVPRRKRILAGMRKILRQ